MKKLLIIDDEMGIVEEIRDFFREEGFEVHDADTGKEGIESIRSAEPDLVLLDIKLPDISGVEVLRICKKEFPAVKVIVSTGYVDQKIIDEAEKLGCDSFMQKPFNLEHLAAEVNRLLQ
jgi:DNA-binding NtrC family response regulator